MTIHDQLTVNFVEALAKGVDTSLLRLLPFGVGIKYVYQF